MKEDWAYTEICLESLASSMGHLLARIRAQISRGIVNGDGWQRLLERASETPVTYAAFPFGLEVPLHDPALRADFGVSLVGNSRTAKYYQDGNYPVEQERSGACLAWILNETDRSESMLRRVAGQKLLLEYDVNVDDHADRSEPGVFLYPVDDILAGGTENLSALHTVHDALVFAGGWDADAAEQQRVEDFYRLLPPNILLRAFGTFPARARTMRIAATGFTQAKQVMQFLSNMGWDGDSSAVGDIVAFFDDCKAFAYLGLHFDITANGMGPNLGLSFFASEKEWLKGIGKWTPALDAIGKQGMAVPTKLATMATASTGTATMMAATGPIMLVRGIHHLKLSITGDQVKQAKAYLFFLMMAART